MNTEKHRRLLREQRERKLGKKPAAADSSNERTKQGGYNRIYHDHYKKLLIFTFGVLLLSLLIIGYTYQKTGDIFYKGVSLSGGLSMSIPTQGEAVDVGSLEDRLQQQFLENDIFVREISELGTQRGITIEARTQDNSRESLEALSAAILDAMPEVASDRAGVSTEMTGPTLGASFFQQTLKAILIAFVFMGMVVFIYFGEKTMHKVAVVILSLLEATLIWYASNAVVIILALLCGAALVAMYLRYSIPSTAVILAAFSTITFTIAAVDVIGMRISTAGLAAFLMLIGYSVDTDILLSTRVLKSSHGTVYERIVSTMKTGLTMTGTTFTACMIALIFAQSDVIREIMTIIAIGIIADIFYTWVQNSGILRWHLEKKGRRSDDA